MKLTQHIGYTAPTANPLLFRTYCRMIEDENGKLVRESAQQAIDRAIRGLDEFGLLTEEEVELITQYFYQNIVFPSGRWFWIGGTDWIKQQKNYIGAYNCASVPVVDWEAFRFNFRALLMGCGVGTVVELDKIAQLPSIKYLINLVEVTELGSKYKEGNNSYENSVFFINSDSEDSLEINYVVGDSKEGWVDVATHILEFSSISVKEIVHKYRPKFNNFNTTIDMKDFKSVSLKLDLSYVRPRGIPLKGFGGLSNPAMLEQGLRDIIVILNNALGRQLNSLEVCKILGIHGVITVAADLRRSARINQGTPSDTLFVTSKDNFWVQDEEGKWKIDPERDMLRFGNHTLVYHVKPSLEEITEAVRKQYYSGEGAIQYAPPSVARCNVDLLNTPKKVQTFINYYLQSIRKAANYLKELAPNMDEKELKHRIRRYGLNPSLRGDTKLLTTEGYKTLEELEGTTFNIINPDGGISESKVWQTGVKETVKLILLQRSTGRIVYIHCTPDHIFLTVDGKEVTAESIYCQEIVAYPKTDEPFRVIDIVPTGVAKVYDFIEPLTNWGVVEGVVTHNCGEILGDTFTCCLSDVHANVLDPNNWEQQEEAFRASTLSALPLLKHSFDVEGFQYSREKDPIIGVCITGLFDFFVHLFGEDWLLWWKEGRPEKYWGKYTDKDEQILENIFQLGDRKISTQLQLDSSLMGGKKKALYFLEVEKFYLTRWKNVVKETVLDFCKRNNLKAPNRYTSIAPSGSKSLLTGASPGWHPPKDTRFIRRITFSKDNAVGQACIDYGYNVVPSPSCKDESGNLLDDINDSRVTEVLVEIPIEVSWANLADKVNFRTKDISALAQLDFYMQVQTYWTGHNTSATIELRENEIEPLAKAIHELIQNDKPYISAALLSRFDALETFPRLPFEPISKERYIQECQDVLARRTKDNFLELVNFHTTMMEFTSEAGSAGCDSDKCLMPEKR